MRDHLLDGVSAAALPRAADPMRQQKEVVKKVQAQLEEALRTLREGGIAAEDCKLSCKSNVQVRVTSWLSCTLADSCY